MTVTRTNYNFFFFLKVVSVTRLASLPPAFVTDKPYAHHYGLALAGLPREDEDKIDAVKNFAQDALNRDLLLNIEYKYVYSFPSQRNEWNVILHIRNVTFYQFHRLILNCFSSKFTELTVNHSPHWQTHQRIWMLAKVSSLTEFCCSKSVVNENSPDWYVFKPVAFSLFPISVYWCWFMRGETRVAGNGLW